MTSSAGEVDIREVRIAEWERVFLPAVVLTASDRRLVSRLQLSNRLSVIETSQGIEIEATGAVGVIRFQRFTLFIEPRLVNGKRNLIGMLDFTRGLGLLRRLDAKASFVARDTNLFDLVAWLLADACDDVLRVGVHADYLAQHEELTTIRGRLDLRTQFLRRWGQVDRLTCEFEERVRDIAENRWLTRALRLARRFARSPYIITRVKRTAAIWEELCDDDPADELVRPERTRQTHHYGAALDLAYMVCDGVSVTDLLSRGKAEGFSFLLDMPRLFEDFLATSLERMFISNGVTVSRQPRDRSILWNPDTNKSFSHVRPDVLLRTQDQSRCLPIDAKYKNYGVQKVGMGDLYQAAVYALALATPDSASQRRHAILVYPATSAHAEAQCVRVHVRVGTVGVAEVCVVGLSVERTLQDSPTGGRVSKLFSVITDRLSATKELIPI